MVSSDEVDTDDGELNSGQEKGPLETAAIQDKLHRLVTPTSDGEAIGAGLLAFATATTSSTTSLSSGGDGGEKRRVLLHWLLHSGYQVGLLAVHGPQLVGLSDEDPNILVVVFAQHDAELGR